MSFIFVIYKQKERSGYKNLLQPNAHFTDCNDYNDLAIQYRNGMGWVSIRFH